MDADGWRPEDSKMDRLGAESTTDRMWRKLSGSLSESRTFRDDR